MPFGLLLVGAILWSPTASPARPAASRAQSAAQASGRVRPGGPLNVGAWARDHSGQSGRRRDSPDEGRESPLDLDQIRDLVGVLPDAALAEVLNRRGINFALDAALLSSLEGAGLGPRTLQSLRAFLSNRAPALSLRAGVAEVRRGESVTLAAEASDADGDALQYRWDATGGTIRGEGESVELDTSEVSVNVRPVQVTVSVTVGDRKGGFASESKTITVWGAESGPSDSSSARREMVAEALFEGKHLVLTVTAGHARSSAPAGAIEVEISLRGNAAEVRRLTGDFPGGPCRVDLSGFENVADRSFKEAPGIGNEWSRLKVRLRPKDARRVVRFVIGWQSL